MSTAPESRSRETAPAGGAAGGPRLLVPDVLRGVALLAMLIAHAVPFLPVMPGWLRFTMANVNDLASPLFALVMGMSAQIVLQRTPRDGIPFMLLQQLTRALILIFLGMWLSGWGSWVAVVLSYLGVTLIVGAPLLFLRTRWLAVAAAVTAVISAPLNAWAQSAFAWVYSDPTGLAREAASWLFLGGSYRLTNLLPFFLFGAILLRHGFRRDRMLWIMLAIAPVAYLVRPVLEALTSGRFGSGSYPDTLHDVGLVFATYVVVVLLATVKDAGAQRAIDAVFVPFRAIGAVALSLYVLHVGLLAVFGFARPLENDYLWWLLIVPGMVLAGWLWWRFVGPGPIEWAMGWATGRRKRRAPVGGGRDQPPPPDERMGA